MSEFEGIIAILLPDRLTCIDEANIGDMRFWSRRTAATVSENFSMARAIEGGATNQLILNYKIKPSIAQIDPRRVHYKDQTIQAIAAAILRVFSCTDAVIPIPPTKTIGDPDYDDRLLKTPAYKYQTIKRNRH